MACHEMVIIVIVSCRPASASAADRSKAITSMPTFKGGDAVKSDAEALTTESERIDKEIALRVG
jgi:hypothetical protein